MAEIKTEHNTPAPLLSEHFAPFAERFDYFIIDLWGVIHDGQHPYPGVLETLELLRKRNKKILLLSNAPRRAIKAVEVLERLGIGSALYDKVLTSGEVTYQHIAQNPDILGKPYVYIGPEKDKNITDGLKNQMVEDAEKAAFSLVTGFDKDDSTLAEKLPQIEACITHGLPLICANPDFEVVRQDGTRLLCAGVIAKEYERRGGKVTYFGKPYPAVYEEALSFFGKPDVSKVAAIGDNLDTDVAGANAQGIYSILCTGGILAEKLKTVSGTLPKEDVLLALCAQENIFPRAVVPSFTW